MEETKFTTGEWFSKEGNVYEIETGKTLAIIPYWDKNDHELEANAKLIAAAPDMFNALIKAEKILGAIDGFMDEIIEKHCGEDSLDVFIGVENAIEKQQNENENIF